MSPSHHNCGRQAPTSALQFGRVNRVALSRDLTERIMRQITAIDIKPLPEVPVFDGPVWIDADVCPDTGFERSPCSHDVGEGC